MIRFILIIVATFIIGECKLIQDDLTFFKQDSGKTVNLVIEDQFLISLEANPATGFTWAVSQIDTALVTQMGDVAFKAGSDRLGAPGIQTFTFNCIQNGNTKLELIYHRPWDTESAPSDTFSLTLHIAD
jgi:inhibitor of cysteine peptidase